MEFHLLGPLEVTRAGEQVDVGGFVRRKLLGILLLYPNQVVSTSRLLNALWPEDHPPTARKMLLNAVSGLRRIISDAPSGAERPVLLTRPPGYVLQVSPACVDLSRFQQLVDRGRADLAAHSHEQARRTLRSALALTRGPSLSDLTEKGIDWPEINALEELILNAHEDCFEAEIAMGRHLEILEEIKVLQAKHPLRERLCGQLMAALYRCGRQVDALAAYERVRSTLVDEFGLEPNHQLRSLQAAVLGQDPSLLSSAMSAPTTTTSPRPPNPPAQRRNDGRTSMSVRDAVRRNGSAPRLVRASVTMVQIHVGSWEDEAATGRIVDLVQDTASAVGREFVRHQGAAQTSFGHVVVGLFQQLHPADNTSARALRAALAIQRVFGGAADRRAPRTSIAVATGDVYVCPRGGDRPAPHPAVMGPAAEHCVQLLGLTSPGELRVCEETRNAKLTTVEFAGGILAEAWPVLTPHCDN